MLKSFVCIVLLGTTCLATALPSHAATPSIETFGWLSGCWEGSSGTRDIDEVWSRPAGEIMLGASRMIRDGQLRNYEYMRIETVSGALTFTAMPAGQETASFPLLESGESILVFENLAHDFPTRITYELKGPQSLSASISGLINGENRSISFDYTRCAP